MVLTDVGQCSHWQLLVIGKKQAYVFNAQCVLWLLYFIAFSLRSSNDIFNVDAAISHYTIHTNYCIFHVNAEMFEVHTCY